MEILAVNVPPLAIFTLMYAIIYLFGYFTIFKNWVGKTRPEASSCLISLSHGTPAVLLSAVSVFQDPKLSFASPNTAFQSTVLDYSIAYFLADTLHYAVFFPTDHLFVAHHLAVLYVVVTCRHVIGHCAFGILCLLLLAEATSPCQNIWSLARIRRTESPAAERLHGSLTPLFYGYYTVVRGVVGPLLVSRMVGFYWRGGGGGSVPGWAWVSWMVVIGGAILLSMLWVSNLWVRFFHERAKVGKLS